jgi:hypothetical protein
VVIASGFSIVAIPAIHREPRSPVKYSVLTNSLLILREPFCLRYPSGCRIGLQIYRISTWLFTVPEVVVLSIKEPKAMRSDIAEKAKNGNFFREFASELQQLPRNDWTEWEWYWLGEMSRKRDSYSFSEIERAKLAQIYSYSRSCSDHDGVTVAEMIRTCHRYFSDFGEEDSDFIVELHNSQAGSVRIRQLRRLVRLYEDAGELIGEVA